MRPGVRMGVAALGAALVTWSVSAGAAPGARRELPSLHGLSSHAPGDVELETWYEAMRTRLDSRRTQWWRLWWGGTLTLSDDTELSSYAVLQQPASGDSTPTDPAARLEMLDFVLSYRVLGRTPDGAARALEPKLVLEWAVPMATPYDEAPESLHTSQILDERLVIGGARGRWSYSLSVGAAQAFGGTARAEGVGMTFGGGLARSFGRTLPWAKYTLGIEVTGDVPVRGPPIHALPRDTGLAAYAGPAASIAVGRFWVSLGLYPSIASSSAALRTRLILAFAL